MLSITTTAKDELDAYFADKEKNPIRIYLAAGGCHGPRLALALDEAREEDQVIEESGYTWCINKELLVSVGSVALDVTPMGFVVEPEIPFATGSHEGGCGGCCGSCGSCGD